MREIFSLVARIRSEGLEKLDKGLKSIDKRATSTANKLNKIGNNLQKVGANVIKLTAPLAIVGVAAFKSVQSLSSLNETISKTGEIFGESAKDIDTWSDTTAVALGQSKQAAMDAATSFAIFGKSAGLMGDDLVNFSTNFTGLASDLSSFFDTKPEEAAIAISAALRGEAEPIRKYGVLLNDATLKAQALKMGLISTTKEALTPQIKVLAASAEIMEQTKDAQGDFARTSDGLANKTRILEARTADLVTTFGKAFLPVALNIVDFLQGKLIPAIQAIIDKWNGLSKGVQNIVIAFAAFLTTVGPVLIVAGKMLTIFKLLVTTFKTLNAVMAANVFSLVVIGIAALVASGIYLYKNWDFVKEKLADAWKYIVLVSQQAISLLKIGALVVLKSYIDTANKLGQYVPFVNKKLAELSDGIDSLIKKEKDLATVRKLDYLQAKVQAQTTDEVTKSIEKAAIATEHYKDVNLQVVKAVKDTSKETDKAAEAAERLAEERTALEDAWNDKVQRSVLNRTQLLEYEKSRALEEADKIGASRQAIEAYYALERIKLSKEEADAKDEADKALQESINQRRQQAAQMGVDALNTLFSLFEQSTDNKIEKLDQEAEKQKEIIENSTLSEEEKAKQIEAIDEEADKKKKALMIKQAKRDKAAAIFAAVVNTFQSVSKALTLGFPLGLIMAGIFGALGIAQVAMIAAKPLPQMADGGLVKKSPGGMQAIVGEGNQDEVVLPLITGTQQIADGVIQGIKNIFIPPALPSSLGGGGSEGSYATSGGGLTINAGVIVGDDAGFKELNRRLEPFRVKENIRTGFANA